MARLDSINKIEADTEVVRLRVSIGGSFQQKPDGQYKYVGGDNFVQSVPVTWRYADFMFSLSEKVDGAVSVKYQLPGEDTDPDTLITLADDSDITSLFDEYFTHLRKATTPVKTFRLQLYLFRAAEEPYTPEDLAAEARYMSTGGIGTLPSGTSSLAASMRCAALETDPDSDAMSGHSGGGGKGSIDLDRDALALGMAPDDVDVDDIFGEEDIEEAELAWEAGFRAGQEAAAIANEEEWKDILTQRMAGLARVASNYMMGEGWSDARRAWSDFSGGRVSPALPDPQSVDSAVAAAAAAATMVEAMQMSQAMHGGSGSSHHQAMAMSTHNNNNHNRSSRFASTTMTTTNPGTAAHSVASRDFSPAEVPDLDADPDFKSMFESKYEVSAAAAAPLSKTPSMEGAGPGFKTTTTNGDDTDKANKNTMVSPGTMLPNHISVFGDSVTLADELAAADIVGVTPPVNLPSHISEFGDDDDDDGMGMIALESDPDAMSVMRAVLPAGDVVTPEGLKIRGRTLSRTGAGGAPSGPPAGAAAGVNGGLGAAAAAAVAAVDAMQIQHQHQGGVLGQAVAGGLAAGLPLPPPGGMVPSNSLPRSDSNSETSLHNAPRIDASSVHVVAKIGEGAFGEVSLCECPTYGRVAVKWIKPTKAEKHWASFWHEADVMSRLNHPNVLRFYGLVVQKNMVVGIMTEFAAQGSLGTLLRSNLGFIPLHRRAQIALHATNGMAYLHSQKVVHFDVKPDNLLVDGDWNSPGPGPVIKVADFGLSVVKYNTFCSNVQDLRGTLPYMAPEMILDHRHVTESADVWSLGVVFWELLTLQVPYVDMAPANLLGALGSGNLRLPIPEWCEPEWRALMEACWIKEPTLRPTCKQLTVQLERILRESAAPFG